MALEYLYDCIRATSGENVSIDAEITDFEGGQITDGCSLALYDLYGATITTVDGTYSQQDGMWRFDIPANATENLHGRYFYCVLRNHVGLNFSTPIYFE